MTRPAKAKRESRAARDTRIVAEAGPWFADVIYEEGNEPIAVVHCGNVTVKPSEVYKAAARVLNRISRTATKKGK